MNHIEYMKKKAAGWGVKSQKAVKFAPRFLMPFIFSVRRDFFAAHRSCAPPILSKLDTCPQTITPTVPFRIFFPG